jgi:hypothetical protein
MKDWNGSYHRLFVRIRDDLRERQRNGAPYIDPAKLDARAWREAQAACESAIRREDEADAIAKARKGEAA